MNKRAIGPFSVQPIGLGCMGLSQGYGSLPSQEDAQRLLHRALDLGYDFLDTASIYGVGKNEKLIGETLKGRRNEFVLASKAGMARVDGATVVDGRPETIKRTLDQSLVSLQTDVIDIYYLHRLDFSVPIEETVGAMKEMVEAGKIRAIGLSEISAKTLRRAHAVHPIAAVQNEYSLWTRNVELGLLDACKELGVAMVAFSPVGRGFLAGGVMDPAKLTEIDMRRAMPRFIGDNFTANMKLYQGLQSIAAEAGCTPAQACLAWLMTKGDHVISIPGTTNTTHLEDNFKAKDLILSDDVIERLEALINERTVAGGRYAPEVQAMIDTEEFA